MTDAEQKIADKVTRKLKGEISIEDMVDEYCKPRQREYMMLVSKEWLDEWSAAVEQAVKSGAVPNPNVKVVVE